MRVAYLTVDEVNQDLAQRLAEDCGLVLYLLTPAEKSPEGPFDAVLYDWDFLPERQRGEILGELRSGMTRCLIGLHSYNVDDEEAAGMENLGMVVSRRLEPELFLAIRRLAEGASANGCSARTLSPVIHPIG